MIQLLSRRQLVQRVVSKVRSPSYRSWRERSGFDGKTLKTSPVINITFEIIKPSNWRLTRDNDAMLCYPRPSWFCDCLHMRSRTSMYNEGPRDWQDLFGITRFCHIESLFHIFHYQWGNMKFSVILRTSLYRGSLNWGSTVFVIWHAWVGFIYYYNDKNEESLNIGFTDFCH